MGSGIGFSLLEEARDFLTVTSQQRDSRWEKKSRREQNWLLATGYMQLDYTTGISEKAALTSGNKGPKVYTPITTIKWKSKGKGETYDYKDTF